ncbi:MAG TPA: hypothetical protein VK459_15590 [Polyangiaceae bacterium]|nr:hypothetical protein [Polyangiaceae bacterium]
MKARMIAAFALLVGAALLPSCGEQEAKLGSSEAPEGSKVSMRPSKKSRQQPALSDLGAKGRRVKVIVLPGDASVEIDGLAARRRNGVVEIAGRVGDVRRLRVFKGAEQLQQDVTIEEAGVSPAVVDLAAPRAKPGGGSGAGAAPVKRVDPLFAEEFE